MNFCKNCINYREHYHRPDCCRASVGKVDLVSGRAFVMSRPVHEMRYSEAFCGAEGKWFEPKEEEATALNKVAAFGAFVTDYVCPHCCGTSYTSHALMQGGVNCRCNDCGTKYHVCAF